MEHRARNPDDKKLRGIRLKLRMAIKELGVTGKFQTDFRRYPELHLIVFTISEEFRQKIEEHLSTFEGYKVKVFKR